MEIGLIGKKVGMTRVFTENGQSIPVTVLKIETNIVSMVKNITSDGYNAIQLSSVAQKENKVKKVKGIFQYNFFLQQ
jgi:large subunit ribosomal protein L3